MNTLYEDGFFIVHPRIVIWGVGNGFKKYITLNVFERAEYLIDNDYAKTVGAYYGDKKIYSQEKLCDESKDILILITASSHYNEISMFLQSIGMNENYNFINVTKISPEIYNNFKEYDFSWYDKKGLIQYDWKKRIQKLTAFIPKNCKSVLDIGGGKKDLKSMLSKGIEYYSMDREPRMNPDYLIDWNKSYELNISEVDYAFASGSLEYIEDLDFFIKQLSPYIKKGVICSYHPQDYYRNLCNFRSAVWKNCYTLLEFIMVFQKYGFTLANYVDPMECQILFLFIKK